MTVFKCQKIPYEEIHCNRKRYNTSKYLYSALSERLAGRVDLSKYEKPQSSEDYAKTLASSAASNWFQLLPIHNQIFSISLSSEQVKVLHKAAQVGMHSGRRPLIFEEELQPIEDYISGEIAKHPRPSNFHGYFVRTDGVSPKDGLNGPGPYFNARDIVNVFASSRRYYIDVESRLTKPDLSDVIHVYPWNPKINCENEWRVFIHKGRVTSISQYSWLVPCKYQEESHLLDLAKEIEIFHHQLVKDATCKSIHLPDNYVMDVCAAPDPNAKWCPLLIELNVFGCQSPAAACTFDWCADFEILYGISNEPEIVIRIVAPENE